MYVCMYLLILSHQWPPPNRSENPLFEPIVRNIWQLFSYILGRAASQKESIARLTAQGKASRLMAGSLVWGLSQKSMPPLLVPADCGTIHLRTSCTTHHEDISCRIPGEKLDARCATRRCTHRSDPHRSLPPGNTEGRDGSQTAPRNARGRQRMHGPPPSVGGHNRSGREHPAR